MNERGREVGGGGVRGEGGGLSPYFNSSLKRVLAAKHLPYSYYPSPASSLKHLPTSILHI